MAGQTLAVHQLFPPTVASSLGRTGNYAQIGVFGAPRLLRQEPGLPRGPRLHPL